jgi:hypothetical protein
MVDGTAARNPKLSFTTTVANGRNGGLPTFTRPVANGQVAPIPDVRGVPAKVPG